MMADILAPGIQAVLHDKLGLDVSSIGPGVIAHAVRDRMAACKLTEAGAYEALLRDSGELQELINAVVVPETWFFRDGEPFRLLQKHAIDTWWPLHPGGKLRIASIACSTGEEPYSIAMALMDAGLSPLNCEIDAVDASTRSLEVARNAVYSSWSFRGKDLSFRERYFSPLANGSKQYKLDPNVARIVKFIHGNVFDPLFLEHRDPYDIVFCRNLLIYFDGPGRRAAIRVLDRLLKPEGLLFVGHAEMLEVLSEKFESVRHPHAFAYRKTSRKPTPAPHASVKASRMIETSRTRPARSSPEARPVRRTQERPAAKEETVTLNEARNLADRGKLQEAAITCERYLVKNPADADAHCLMGIILEAMGDRGHAEICFHRSLYLDSQHQEALWHLVLLLEGKGEHAQAEVLRQRVSRLKSRGAGA